MSDAAAAQAPEKPAESGASTAKSTGIVSVAVLCSRVLGLVRDQVLQGCFGSLYNGIFLQAFMAPNMLRDLFAEGALSTAFVTTFSKKIKTEGDAAAWQLGRKMLTLAAVFMTLVTVVGIFTAPWQTRLLVPGWSDDPWKWELATSLTQIMFPFIAIVSVTALVMGMLNAKRHFFVPAVASAFFNLGCIVGGLLLAFVFDPGFRRLFEPGYHRIDVTWNGLACFAVGTLIGGLAQLGVQLPSLRKVGFRFRPDFQWRDPGVRTVLHLMWPSLIAAGGTQINVMVNSIFASFTWGDAQAKAWLTMAQRLQQLPLGLFGVAVATVTLPALSRAATEGITPSFRRTLVKGLGLVLFLVIPCGAGIMLFSHEILSVLFEHGKTTSFDCWQAARALHAYAFGLVFYACLKVLQPAFFAIDRRFVPMTVSLSMIAFNLIVNWITVFKLGWDHEALAWATAASIFINFCTLYVCMRKFAGHLYTRELLKRAGLILVAVAAMLLICAGPKWMFVQRWEHWGFLLRVTVLGGTISMGALTYFGMAHKLRIEEAADFTSIILRRFGKK